MATKNYPFTAKDIINEFGDYKRLSIDFNDWSGGVCGGEMKHTHYSVSFGDSEFSDGGKYTYLNSLISDTQERLKAMENELKEHNILMIKGSEMVKVGTDIFHYPRYSEMECIKSLVKIVPCKSFIELQKWLKDNAKFYLFATDVYRCNVCQKRNSVSRSNFEYLAEYESNSSKFLSKLKETYKRGYKIVASIIYEEEIENYDRNQFEYEQYGNGASHLIVTISTPSGRNKQILTF